MVSYIRNYPIVGSILIVFVKQTSGFCLPDRPCANPLKQPTTTLPSTPKISPNESSAELSDSSIEEFLFNSFNASDEYNEYDSFNASDEYGEYDNEFEITSRSLIYGRSCFSTSGFFGSCSTPKYCRNRPFSYSRTCGFSYICCKSLNRKTPTNFPVTSRTTRRTTRTTTPRPRRSKTTTATYIDFYEPQVDNESPIQLKSEGFDFESLNTPGCGVSIEEFIFGGQVAKKGALPYMVSFVETFGPSWRKQVENFCGGVLISPRHVLTAAHCFSKVRRSDWKRGRVDVRLGLIDITDKESPQIRVNIANVKIHEFYQETQEYYFNPVNDIAVVTLDRSISLGRDSGVNTVCLPTRVADKSDRTGLVAGWGTTTQAGKRKHGSVNKLRFAYISEFGRDVCSKKYNDLINKKGSRLKISITENMLCAGNNIADTCAGDSGGPLLWIDSEYRYAVAGIVSFGPSSCGNVVPGVYTKVQNYLRWIREQIAT